MDITTSNITLDYYECKIFMKNFSKKTLENFKSILKTKIL